MREMRVDSGSLQARVASYDEESRSFRVVWSTGADVQRRSVFGEPFIERLSLRDDSVDLSRLNSGRAPLLRDHDHGSVDSVIGVVERAWVEHGTGYATVRLSRRDNVSDLAQDLRDGVLGSVSVGYSVSRYERQSEPNEDGVEVLQATRWTPQEISLVPIGADSGAYARSSLSSTAIVTDGGDEMAEQEQAPEAAETVCETSETPAETRALDVDVDAAVAQALSEERARCAGIRSAVRKARLEGIVADELVERGLTLDEARAAIIDQLAEQDARTDTRSGSPVCATRRDTDFVAWASDALLCRAGRKPLGELSAGARDAYNMSLFEVGKAILSQRNVSTRGSELQLITRMLSTDDFVQVVASVANRAMLDGYAEMPTTYDTLARQVTVSNFSQVDRLRMSAAPELLMVPEGGEIQKGPMSSGSESYRVHTYARRVAMTRQAIINDDLDMLARVPAAFGAKARQLENRMFYELLASNPTMSDGNKLFSTAHGNLASTPAVISLQAIAEMRLMMRTQMDGSGNPVYLQPQYLVFGPSSALNALQVLDNPGNSPTSTADVVPQTFKTLQMVEDPEITGSEWYLFAAPVAVDTFEYAYLSAGGAGVTTGPGPQIDSRPGWEILGVDTRCVLDFGVGAIDWVGVCKNDGA